MRPASTRKTRPETIDDYLAALGPGQRAALQRLRRTIKRVAPRAEECISYQVPAFRLDGRMLVWFAASANHCAFYPGGIVQEYTRELEDFDIGKGTIRFQPDHPLPVALVRRIVKARIARSATARRVPKQGVARSKGRRR